MIVVLEGASGSGKSTLMKELVARTAWPVYRAFRSNENDHAPGAALKALGIPVNTWMEDLYAADLLSVVRGNVILDRSIPSALAYDEMGLGTGLSVGQRAEVLELWARRMVKAGGSIFVVVAPTRVLAERSGRFSLEHLETEQALIRKYAAEAWRYGVRVHEAHTTYYTPELTVRWALEYIDD